MFKAIEKSTVEVKEKIAKASDRRLCGCKGCQMVQQWKNEHEMGLPQLIVQNSENGFVSSRRRRLNETN